MKFSNLTKAILRMFKKSPGRIIGLISLIAVSITVYAGTFMPLNQIESTTHTLYHQLKLFDFELRIEPNAKDLLPTTEDIKKQVPHIKAVDWRLTALGNIKLENQHLAGVVLMAVDAQKKPDVSDVDIVEGQYLSPQYPFEIIIDKTFAQDLNLAIGDNIEVRVKGHEQKLKIRGIGIFPEFLMNSIDDSCLMPARKTLAAIMVPQELITETMKENLVNSLVVQISGDRYQRDSIKNDVTTFLNDNGARVTSTILSEDQYSVYTNWLRLAAYRDFLPTMVAIFNGLVVLVMVLTIQKILKSNKRELAALMALGLPEKEITLAFVAAFFVFLVFGGILGIFGAYWLSFQIKTAYVSANGFPVLLGYENWISIVEAWFLSAIVMLPAIIFPLHAMLKQKPIQLLYESQETPEKNRSFRILTDIEKFLTRLLRLKFPERLGLRNILRRPVSFISSTLIISALFYDASAFYLFAQGQSQALTDYLNRLHWNYLISLEKNVSPQDLKDILSETQVSQLVEIVIC